MVSLSPKHVLCNQAFLPSRLLFLHSYILPQVNNPSSIILSSILPTSHYSPRLASSSSVAQLLPINLLHTDRLDARNSSPSLPSIYFPVFLPSITPGTSLRNHFSIRTLSRTSSTKHILPEIICLLFCFFELCFSRSWESSYSSQWQHFVCLFVTLILCNFHLHLNLFGFFSSLS